MKIKSKLNKILIHFTVFVFLLLAGFFYGENVPQARADSELITKEGVVFTGGPGASNYARVIKVGLTYHMWYEDTTLNLFYHTTSADGETWAVGDMTNIQDGHEPSVIWDASDSKYKIWFEVAGTGLLSYAESANGIDWNGLEGPLDPPEVLTFTDIEPHNWENNGRHMPFVIKDGATYKLWYQSFSNVGGEAGDRRINYATSADGISWNNSYHIGNVEFQGSSDNNIVFGMGDPGDWDVGALYSFMIGKFSDGTFGMMYAAHDGDNIYKLGVAYSENPDPDDNGIKWDRGDSHAISEAVPIYFPSFTEESNGYKFWYVDGTGNVYYATSFFDDDILGGDDEDEVDDNDDNDDNHGAKYKQYRHYRKEYKGAKHKGNYWKVKEIKKTDLTLFIKMKAIYEAHRSDKKSEFDRLDQETKDLFDMYEDYRGYKRYRKFKEELNL
ncbi:MAG: hypothetical protein V1804_01515 [Patescibacteria group bacterium]